MTRYTGYVKDMALYGNEPYTTALYNLPIAIIPLIVGALDSRASAQFFRESDALNGLYLVRWAQMALMKPYAGDEKLYRLLDNALNGNTYTELPTGDIIPPIPAIPNNGTEGISMRERLVMIQTALENMGGLDEEEQAELLGTLVQILGALL